MASSKWATSPKRLKSTDFDVYVGNSINECEEFVWRKMEDFKQAYGNPVRKANHFVDRFLPGKEKDAFVKRMTNELSWYKGESRL